MSAQQTSVTKATSTPEKDTLLQKIAAVNKEHDEINSNLVALKDAGAATDAAAWAEFGKGVDTASDNLKKAVELLKSYQPQTVTEEDVIDESTNDTFSEYEKLYKAITGALVNTSTDKTKDEVKTSDFDSLIFTDDFNRIFPTQSETDPIRKFIMAIKDYSYNSNANKINSKLQISESQGSDLNHQLLKAVLDALAPSNVRTYLARQKPNSLDDLLTKLTIMINSEETNPLTSKITSLFTDTKPQGGGGSSSSSSSKKNRKSHKSYHPDIGKTRKHHSHTEPKRVSFVHQA